MFAISKDPLAWETERKALFHPRAGALVTFEGWVRNHHEGRDVLHLEYEAYESLCLKEAKALEEDVLENFDVMALRCIHRVGHCGIGELAVWVGVTAEHREPAFAACEYYMNQLKVRLPIWKKETYVDGTSGWVRCEACAAHEHD
jgi:molybdopterin synthase catalytic subunit